MIHTRKSAVPYVALIASTFLWGGSFAATREIVKVLNSWSLVWIRMLLGLVFILPFWKHLDFRASYRRGDWKYLIPMVLFQPCLYFLCETNALRFTTSSQAGVISALVPLFVALGARLFLSEKLSLNTGLGLGFSIGGLVMLTWLGNGNEQASNAVLGNTLEVSAMIAAAANMIILKKLSDRYNPWCLTALQVIGGAVFFLPGAVFLMSCDASIWTPGMIIALVYLGVFVTLGAFGLYNWGMSRVSATGASAFINLVPVIAVIVGWSVLGESLSPAQLLCAGAVLGGVLLSQLARR